MHFRTLLALACFTSALLNAGQKWMKQDYTRWTPQQGQQILGESPWAKQAPAIYGSTDEDPRNTPAPLPTPAQAGLSDPTHGRTPGTLSADGRGADDGKWDGGVGRLPRGSVPKIPVLVRWDSALPVREALLQSHARDLRDSENTLAKPEKDYIITLIGLLPAHNGSPQIAQGLINAARLMPQNRKSIAPEDVRIDESTGTIQLFFPRTAPITLDDKEVVFTTVFGSMKIIQRFRLKDMLYRGKLEL